ncbi:MAG TPA: aspartate-semialdehyde dehydrogenase [Herpetosiphonaceae bacterium]
MAKIPVGVLGATGMVGQRFLSLLLDHPWFEVAQVAASDRSAGKTLGEAGRWLVGGEMPARFASMTIQPVDKIGDVPVVFSALPGEVAGETETAWAQAGALVFSNAGAHRRDPLVPLLVPEVNYEHVALLEAQRKAKGWRGAILTNPNCTTTHAVLPMRPLHDRFGIKKVVLVSMQALSGAGYPGVPSLDVLDNVVPLIKGEEEKVEWEPRKLLGALENGAIREAEIAISAHCNRVAVSDGHTECLSLGFERPPADAAELIAALREWRSLPQELRLPSAPEAPVLVTEAADGPQPRRDRNAADGMATTVGRVRPCPILDYKLVLLGHNTIRGAAGGSLLNAELLAAQGLIPGVGVPGRD